MRCSLADENKHQNESADPGVLFKRVDHFESENGDQVGQHCNNDDSHSDGHVVVGDCAEDLAYDHLRRM